jgi:hypothetical protein
LYLTKLAETLDQESPQWRNDTVFLLDGAPYHVKDETIKHLKLLNISTIFTGPYAYESCVCEFYFAYMKSCQWNPMEKSCGKKVSKINVFL